MQFHTKDIIQIEDKVHTKRNVDFGSNFDPIKVHGSLTKFVNSKIFVKNNYQFKNISTSQSLQE